jgi:signal transduction histidine kinase
VLPQQNVAELDQGLIGAVAPLSSVPKQRSGKESLPEKSLPENSRSEKSLPTGPRPSDRLAVAALALDQPALPSPIVLHAPVDFARRTGAYCRAHRDGLLDIAAVALALANALLTAAFMTSTLLVVVSLCAPLLLLARRRFPITVTMLAGSCLAFGFGQLIAMIALGTVARRHRWHWQTLALALALWAVRVLCWPFNAAADHDALHHYLFATVVGGVGFGLPVLIGVLLATSGELRAKVDELATSKATLTALAVERALAEERARIAREMHDVVSHQVALIAMQASALQVCGDADRIGTAKTIRGLCTKTLNELRTLVGTLRSPDGRRLDELAALAKESGAVLHLDVDLPRDAVPGAVANAAYRTVQEALTNARKYAPESAKTVSIRSGEAELVVEVRNEAPVHEDTCDLPSGGHGLLGLRERNEGVGGRMSAGSTASGGFLVRTRYPLPTMTFPC